MYDYVPSPYENGILIWHDIFTNKTSYWLGFDYEKACVVLSILEDNDSTPVIYMIYAHQVKWEIVLSEVFYDFEFGVYITGFISSLIISMLYKPIKNYILNKRKKG